MISTKAIIIAVNYHSEYDTLSLIREFDTLYSKEDIRLIIVDNSKSFDKRYFDVNNIECNNIWILTPNYNLGYLGAAHWGLQEYLKSNPMPDWIMLSNTDIKFNNKNIFEQLFTSYANEEKGIIAPSIYSTLSCYDQNPFLLKRPTKWEIRFKRLIFSNYVIAYTYQHLSLLKKWFLSKIKRGTRPFTDLSLPYETYAAHGSFIIINRVFFDRGGSLDYGAFLFGEEIFIAENAARLGIKILYDPRITVIHNEHSAIGIIKNKRLIKYLYQSLTYLEKTFFNLIIY